MSSYFTDFFLAFNLSVVFGVTLDGSTSFVDAWFKVLGSKPRGAFVLLLRFYISSPTQKYLRFSVSVSVELFVKMLIFTVIGDSNVRDNMTTMNMASRDVMKAAQIITSPAVNNLAAAFLEVR